MILGITLKGSSPSWNENINVSEIEKKVAWLSVNETKNPYTLIMLRTLRFRNVPKHRQADNDHWSKELVLREEVFEVCSLTRRSCCHKVISMTSTFLDFLTILLSRGLRTEGQPGDLVLPADRQLPNQRAEKFDRRSTEFHWKTI